MNDFPNYGKKFKKFGNIVHHGLWACGASFKPR